MFCRFASGGNKRNRQDPEEDYATKSIYHDDQSYSNNEYANGEATTIPAEEAAGFPTLA